MSTVIKIRPTQHDDYTKWSTVYESYLTFYKTSLTDNELKRVWSWIENKRENMHCYLAQVGDDVIGLVHFRLFLRPIKASQSVYMDDLIVLPQYRGIGAGFKLVQAVKEYAKEQGLPLVRWITAKDNEKAMKLYDQVADKTSWVTYDLDATK